MKFAVLCLVTLVASSGCSKFFGNLRRDFDDEPMASEQGPTVGGRWSERGFLSDDVAESSAGSRYVGHSERNPASASGGEPGQGSWVSPEEAEEAQRDQYRAMPVDENGNPLASFSNSPNFMPANGKRLYKNGARAKRDDFIDESQNEGSLWASNGQTNYYFTKNKIRSQGDIVSITMEADLIKDAITEIKRTLSPHEKEVEIGLAQDRIREKVLGAAGVAALKAKDAISITQAAAVQIPTGDAPATPAKKEEPEKEVPVATAADIDVVPSLELKAGETMMGEIVERYPNGNYKIRATKRIPYRSGYPRLLTLVGIAKSTDITEEDVVTSGKLYEYRLEVLH